MLYKTSLGLNIRAVGENPNAASSVGVSVLKIKYIAIGFSGLMCGFGGAFMPCRWSDIDWSEPSEPTIACKECGQVYTEMDIKGLDHEYSPPANADPFKDNFGRIWRSFEVFGTLCHSFYSWKSLRDYEHMK